MVKLFQVCLPIATLLAGARLGGLVYFITLFYLKKVSKIGINLVGYTFRLKNYIKIPLPAFLIFQSWRRHCVIPAFLVPSGYIITICPYLLISHHNIFRNFCWNGRPFSSYCCGNVNVYLVRFSHVPTLIPRFVQCVTGLLRLLLARSWLVLLVTGLLLACSACYWPVPCLFRLLLACSACSVF